MMSSSSAMSAPAHPEPAEDQPAAIDECHPQVEGVADEEITDQRQRRDAKTDRDERLPDPQSSDGVDQHKIDRPERSHLPRCEMPEPVGEEAEGDEQEERRKHPDIESSDTGPRMLRGADDDRPRDPRRIHREPPITG